MFSHKPASFPLFSSGEIKVQYEHPSFLLEESKETYYDLSSIFYLFELGQVKWG